MDKETLSHYGWIVIISLVLTVMIALATPFGKFVGQAVSNTVRGFAGTAQTKFDGSDFDADQFELDYNKDKQEWEYAKGGTIKREVGSVIPDGATYTKANGTTLNGNGTNTFPDTPQTGDTYEEGDYVYTYNKGTKNGIPYGTEWSVKVKDKTKAEYGPLISEIAGKPLTNACETFFNCTSLTAAPTIPSSVTNMYSTFSCCTSLTTAPAIPNSVTYMINTFKNCSSLTTAPTIPNGVTNMFSTFWNCTSLTTAPAIPNSVTNMDHTFRDCTKLTTAPTIPNSVTNMQGTFWGCTKLTTAPTIPNSVTSMDHTFYDCTSLITAPAIPNSVTNMESTFEDCTSLTGTIKVNANPSHYTECLKNTQITGIIGSCSQATKDALMATK